MLFFVLPNYHNEHRNCCQEKVQKIIESEDFKERSESGKYSHWFNSKNYDLIYIIKVGFKNSEKNVDELGTVLYRSVKPEKCDEDVKEVVLPEMDIDCLYGIVWYLGNFRVRWF